MYTDIGLVLIRLKIDKIKGNPALIYDSQYIASMEDETSPVFSVDPVSETGMDCESIDLSPISPRSIGFSIGLIGGTGSGFYWHPDPTQSLAIAISGQDLIWGQVPQEFTSCKNNGGNLTFMDNSNADGNGMEYEYTVRVFAKGDPSGLCLTFDPKIRNSAIGTR